MRHFLSQKSPCYYHFDEVYKCWIGQIERFLYEDSPKNLKISSDRSRGYGSRGEHIFSDLYKYITQQINIKKYQINIKLVLLESIIIEQGITALELYFS